jgi:hypothetical protein
MSANTAIIIIVTVITLLCIGTGLYFIHTNDRASTLYLYPSIIGTITIGILLSNGRKRLEIISEESEEKSIGKWRN